MGADVSRPARGGVCRATARLLYMPCGLCEPHGPQNAVGLDVTFLRIVIGETFSKQTAILRDVVVNYDKSRRLDDLNTKGSNVRT
jgi:hypothetical protein